MDLKQRKRGSLKKQFSLADGINVTEDKVGDLPSGEAVNRYTVSNRMGSTMEIMTYGGAVTALKIVDANGRPVNVLARSETSGKPNLDDYVTDETFRYATVLGPVAGIVSNAAFKLNAGTFKLDKNAGPHHLHGGMKGFSHKNFELGGVRGSKVTLVCHSEDKEDGYPGNVRLTVSYQLTNQNEVVIDYQVTTDADTPINVTQNLVFNLSGAGGAPNLEDHVFKLTPDAYLAVDGEGLPTGEMEPVEGSRHDLRGPARLEENQGSEVCYTFSRKSKDSNLQNFGSASSTSSGIEVEISSTQPCLAFSTKRPGFFAAVPMGHPNAVNQENFPSVVLHRGAVYYQAISLQFSVRK